jgi:HK97 family phage major capsid protein
MAANVPYQNIGGIMNANTVEQLMNLSATDGQPLQMPMLLTDMRKAYTQAVKSDYGTGNDETRIYFGDFSEMVVGFQGAFEFRLDERYKDYLQTGFLIHMRADIQVKHPEAFCILENIATA